MSTARLIAAAAAFLAPAASLAQAQAAAKSNTSDAAYIRKAETGAPRSIASNASVARIEKDGKVTTLRTGTNGFTCTRLPDGTDAPYCGDKNAWPWMVAAMTRQPKPPNKEPGVAYMAAGGIHFETPKGEIVMEPGANTHNVKEPPHWMLMWPVDPATSGLPTRENPMGVYVMFAGTPYAHLMVYQNPTRLKVGATTKE
jgi:hypothetical protein